MLTPGLRLSCFQKPRTSLAYATARNKTIGAQPSTMEPAKQPLPRLSHLQLACPAERDKYVGQLLRVRPVVGIRDKHFLDFRSFRPKGWHVDIPRVRGEGSSVLHHPTPAGTRQGKLRRKLADQVIPEFVEPLERTAAR